RLEREVAGADRFRTASEEDRGSARVHDPHHLGERAAAALERTRLGRERGHERLQLLARPAALAEEYPIDRVSEPDAAGREEKPERGDYPDVGEGASLGARDARDRDREPEVHHGRGCDRRARDQETT